MNHKPRHRWGLLAAMICAAALLFSDQTMAQGLKIAVIDFDAAVQGFPLTKQRVAEQEARHSGYQALLKAIDDKAQDLEAERDAFREGTPEWSAKNEEFKAQVFMLRERTQRLRNQADSETTELFLELYSGVNTAIEVFAKQHKFDLVLRSWPLDRLQGPDDKGMRAKAFSSRDVLFSSPRLDRTKDFIDFLKSWKPAAQPSSAKKVDEKTSPPAKTSK